MRYELPVQYENRKSFYGKAIVQTYGTHGEIKVLRSYGIEVAKIENGKAEVRNTFSMTTLRHIKEFLKQFGFKAESKEQILTDYAPKK